MDFGKILKRGLILALIVVAVAFVGGAGDAIITFFVPPRVFYVIGAVIIVILLKILFEIRNNKEE